MNWEILFDITLSNKKSNIIRMNDRNVGSLKFKPIYEVLVLITWMEKFEHFTFTWSLCWWCRSDDENFTTKLSNTENKTPSKSSTWARNLHHLKSIDELYPLFCLCVFLMWFFLIVHSIFLNWDFHL